MESRAHKFQMFSPLIIIFHIYMLLLFVISGFKYKKPIHRAGSTELPHQMLENLKNTNDNATTLSIN